MADDDYKVGYKKPPKHSRFRPGRSGNPRGRPKGQRNFWTEVLAELNGRIDVTAQGQRRSLTRMTVLAKTIVSDALTGDAKAREQVIRQIIDRLQPPNALEAVAAPSSAEDRKTLDLMRDRVIAEFLARTSSNKKRDDRS